MEKKKPSILVVEDDAEMRETLSDILLDEGYLVRTAGKGKEGLAAASEEKFPICLIDLKLPDISGIEVLKGVKALNPETYAIIITAFASKETAIETLKAGARYYIEKPPNMEELLATIEHASAEHQLLADKRRAEEELRKSEEKYRSLVESTEDSVYLVDRDCRYLFMNKRHLSRLGLSEGEFLGRPYSAFHSAEEAKKFAEKVNRVIESGSSLTHEYEGRGQYFFKTLSPVKYPETGVVTAVTVVSKDITELKRTEKELIETKDYVNNVIESSADAIVVIDMNGIVRDWNRGAEDYMGYTAEEVIGTSNRKFFADPEEADRILERVKREREIKDYRTIALRKDGTPVHVSMSAALLKDKSGVPIGTVRVSRDITKEAELEERIKEERDNLNLILESMVDGVYLVSEDYKVEFMNKVLRDAVGDNIGDTCYKVFHNREAPCPLCKHPEVLKGKTERWEWHSRRSNRSYDLIETPLRNSEGNISKLTIFRDITKRKRAEMALRQKSEEQKALLSTIPALVYFKDRNDTYIAANKAFADMTGTTIDEIAGKTDYDFFTRAEADFFRRCDQEVMESGEPMYNIEEPVTGADGKKMWVSTSKTPFFDSDGSVIGMVGITQDISEQKRAEEERELLIKELEAKNSEMERFVYTVSHDLRSPLVTIQGFVGMLRKDIEENERERVETDLAFIGNATAKMDRLLSDTLQLSRIGRVVNPPEDVPFGELVQEALGQTTTKINSSGAAISVAEDFPAVHVDRMRIVEVLVNLIENSINYTVEESKPTIAVDYRVEGDETVFFVRDNGIGMDESQHEKVFQLFYKIDKGSKGTGAGLAIVKRIVEVHEGRIWIESETGKGCTICFTLPVVGKGRNG
jgi:PAS domain S-box-containing protein